MKARSYYDHAARGGKKPAVPFEVVECHLAPIPGTNEISMITVVEHRLTGKTYRSHVLAWRARVAAITSGKGR